MKNLSLLTLIALIALGGCEGNTTGMYRHKENNGHHQEQGQAK